MQSVLAAFVSALLCLPLTAAETGAGRLFELRTYHASPGKLDALLARFRDHTCRLFEKHGMSNLGYWVPATEAPDSLVYLLSYPDRASRDTAWEKFLADNDWQEAKAASEKEGKLVETIEQRFLMATDFSPGFPATTAGQVERLYELRTYTTPEGKLPDLLKRFREHTTKFFVRHGMTNGGYFTPAKGQDGAENTLVYFLAHQDASTAEKSWADFRADPDWVAAKKASEDAAGGSLTVPDGVESLFLKPVDFSPLK